MALPDLSRLTEKRPSVTWATGLVKVEPIWVSGVPTVVSVQGVNRMSQLPLAGEPVSLSVPW